MQKFRRASLIILLFAGWTATGSLARSDQVAAFAGKPAAPGAVARSCMDMDGKIYQWGWPNVPFVAFCPDGPVRTNRATTKASLTTSACIRACSGKLGECLKSEAGEIRTIACFDYLDACMTQCDGVQRVKASRAARGNRRPVTRQDPIPQGRCNGGLTRRPMLSKSRCRACGQSFDEIAL
jgi:hypothetical protein